MSHFTQDHNNYVIQVKNADSKRNSLSDDPAQDFKENETEDQDDNYKISNELAKVYKVIHEQPRIL